MSELPRYFYRSYDEILRDRVAELSRKFPPVIKFKYNIECFDDDLKLFDLHLSQFKEPHLIINSGLDEPEKSRILDTIDRAGARVPYRCEFYPSTNSQQSANYEQLGVTYPNIHESVETKYYKNFEQWFLNWVDKRLVALDTCIVLNHYLGQVIQPEITKQMKIVIPRFVLLELEAIGNRGSKLDKRLAFSAFNEIRNLRLETGASTFASPIKSSLLAQFAQISSSRGADSFIRLELWDRMHETGAKDQRERQIVLLTRDMIMACTASAENIDTFYFSTAEPEKTEFILPPGKSEAVITETAITFDKVRVEGIWDGAGVIIEGMWSGKNILDWARKKLRVHLEPHNKET